MSFCIIFLTLDCLYNVTVLRLMKRLLPLILILLAAGAHAQTPIFKADLSVPSRIAPAFFGPNAFPVPEMSDGRTSSEFKLELYADSYFGTIPSSATEDFTADIFARATLPLFSSRVNLSLWMPVQEYYSTGPEVNAYRRIGQDGHMTGWVPGDVYVSTDIMILMQEKHQIDAVIRAVLKSASGYCYHYARNYDGPGYFFDATFARSFPVGSGSTVFRTALSGGFLCWQTDNGRQNDAVMYGILASMKSGRFALEAEYGGYVGWEQCGDAPMTLKTSASWDIGDLSLRLQHQVGFVDWPFHQIRFGVEYRFRNLFKTSKK